ncbi:MAG: hypothetical protein Q4E54_01975 [Lachnospiraceae bacterium]|nr:hypothetical protein [Lachnospiraceae bacterium]
MRKRILSILLAAIMIVSLLPTVSFAAGEHTHSYTNGLCECGACDGTHPSGTWTNWGDEESEWTSLPSTAGSYYLTHDVTLTNPWEVPEGTTNLCLSGHVIQKTGDRVIWIDGDDKTNGVTLNLYDCNTTTTHKFGDDNGLWTWDDTLEGDAIKHTVTGGVITGGAYAGVYVSKGSFTMNGGSICGNKTGSSGGGVDVRDGSSFTMNGGSICGNTGSTGGVRLNVGSFTMNGGSISNNTASSSGGGLNLVSGSFTMNGGTISYNKATSGSGGGVQMGPTTFIMTGGSISNNTAGSQGGGVYQSGGSFTMTGGTISENTAQHSGGGVYTDGSFTVGGTAKITGNTVSGAANNLNPKWNAVHITIGTGSTESGGNGVDKPAAEMLIGLTTQNMKDKIEKNLTDAMTTNGTADDLKYFFSDNSSLYVNYNSAGHLELAAPRSVTFTPNDYGEVTVSEKEPVKAGTSITLTVVPKSGCKYNENTLKATYSDDNGKTTKGITLTPTETAGQYTFTMPAYPVTVTANFEPLPHNVTAQVQGSHGTAEAKVNGATVSEAVASTSVAFYATPSEDYEFDYWEVVSGGITLSETETEPDYKYSEEITVTMPDEALTLKAHFKEHIYTNHNIIVEDDGHGTAKAQTGGKDVTGRVAPDTDVTLVATPSDGYAFKEWEIIRGLEAKDITGNTFKMPSNEVKVKAIFGRVYNINLQTSDDTHGSVKAQVDGSDVTTAAADASVTLVPQAEDGYKFDRWEVVSGTFEISDNSFTMPESNVTIKAIFVEKPVDECEYTKTVSLKKGTFGMKLGGKDNGEFTFASYNGGWSIKNSDDKYLAMADGKLTLSNEPFAWTYKNGAFYTTVKTTQTSKSSGGSYGIIGWILGWGGKGKTTTKEVTTTYYLSTTTEGSKLSTCCVSAELYEKVTGEHKYGECWTDCKDGENHKQVCKNCGKEVTEPHVFEEGSELACKKCGAANPAKSGVKISVTVKEETQKQRTGFWIFGKTKTVKVYKATIKTEATGVKVSKVEYSLNGGKWTKGTTVTSNNPIESLKVRVTDKNGKVYEYTYPEDTAGSEAMLNQTLEINKTGFEEELKEDDETEEVIEETIETPQEEVEELTEKIEISEEEVEESIEKTEEVPEEITE